MTSGSASYDHDSPSNPSPYLHYPDPPYLSLGTFQTLPPIVSPYSRRPPVRLPNHRRHHHPYPTPPILPPPSANMSDVNIPQLVFLAVVGFLVIRWCLKPSGPSDGLNSSSSSSSSSHRNAATSSTTRGVVPPDVMARVDRVAQMFPQLEPRVILWDLQRNGGNVQVTIERMLTTGRLDTVSPLGPDPPPPPPFRDVRTTSGAGSPVTPALPRVDIGRSPQCKDAGPRLTPCAPNSPRSPSNPPFPLRLARRPHPRPLDRRLANPPTRTSSPGTIYPPASAAPRTRPRPRTPGLHLPAREAGRRRRKGGRPTRRSARGCCRSAGRR